MANKRVLERKKKNIYNDEDIGVKNGNLHSSLYSVRLRHINEYRHTHTHAHTH